MKKLISLALAIFMIMSLATVAFAADERPSSGTIDEVRGTITINNLTIENGAPTATIAIYQILKLESYDFTSGSYFYAYNSEWETFFTSADEVGKNYIVVNDKGLIEWNGSKDADRVAGFAKAALAYAEENNIAPTKSTANTPAEYTVPAGTNSIVFGDLELGYYLVDSSVGALCGLSTTNPDGIINSKNSTPTLEKQVQEDLSQQFGATNSADIGQDVNYRITIHVHDGAQKYVVHDTMDSGLTFKPESLVVTLVDGSGSGTHTTVSKDGNYDVVTNTDGCTFQVVFTDAFCNSLNTNDRLVITYTATLNEDAEIGNGTAENPANENKASMTYGDNHRTGEVSTTTKTYAFDLVKTDGQNKLLDGSEFKIYDAEVGGNEVPVVLVSGATTPDGYNVYRKANTGETGATVIVVRGKVQVIGLDNGVYYLEETKAPDGFNAITSRQKFTISDNNLDAIITDGIVSVNSGVQVVNNTGSMLPETGGLGTVLFTVLGGSTALGTGVVLVTKKRMSKIEDEE